MEWQVRAILGKTTASENSVEAIREAVKKLLDEMVKGNQLDPEQIINATFSVTRDLDATFPAAIARACLNWEKVPLLDVQQMHVEDGRERCIQLLIHANIPASQIENDHPFLQADKLIEVEEFCVEWRVRAIRGATTVSENSVEAIREAVTELLDALQDKNKLHPEQIISATFTVTKDLDAAFPAAIARSRPLWNNVPLLDVQQMHVKGGLKRCIRLLTYVNIPASQVDIYHPYLRKAKDLRPDWSLASLS